MPMMPWRPMLTLMNPIAANVSAFVHTGSARESVTLGWPLFHAHRAAAMVNSAWRNVPMKSHARVLAPMRSPMRPMNAPATKVVIEVRACLSARWKVVSRCPGGPWKRRASARDSCGGPGNR